MILTSEEIKFIKEFKEVLEPKFNLLVQKEKNALLESTELESKIFDPDNADKLCFYFSKSEPTSRITINQSAIKQLYPYDSIPEDLKRQIYKVQEIAPIVRMSFITDDDTDEI